MASIHSSSSPYMGMLGVGEGVGVAGGSVGRGGASFSMSAPLGDSSSGFSPSQASPYVSRIASAIVLMDFQCDMFPLYAAVICERTSSKSISILGAASSYMFIFSMS